MAEDAEDVDAAVAAIIQSAKKNEHSAPRKHHLIPASYLRRWSVRGRLRVTETTTKYSYTPAPERAARETDFYSLASKDIDPDKVPPLLLETLLSQVEGDGKCCIDILIERGPTGLDAHDALRMATYLGFQMTRGRGFRQQVASTIDKALKLVTSHLTDEDIARRLVAQGRDASPEAVASTRQALDMFARGEFRAQPQRAHSAGLAADFAGRLAFWLLGRCWRVYETQMPLITCDDPVVAIPGPRKSPRTLPGVATAGAFVFPLDPHHLLAMFHPGVRFDELVLYPHLLPLEVDEINLALAAHSDRWLFERASDSRTLTLCVPPWDSERTAMDEINVVNRNDGEYYRSTRPTRWQFSQRPPPPPVARWWRNAHEAGLHDIPYNWEEMEYAMYNVLG